MESAAALSRLLGPLRRAVLGVAREAGRLPDLPEAQIELLRALQADPGSSPRQVAAGLRLASSTVSNLVKTMAAAGLVERRSSAIDLRAAELKATPAALELLARYDRTSADALSQAIVLLSVEDQRVLTAAVPVLGKLLTALRDGDGSR